MSSPHESRASSSSAPSYDLVGKTLGRYRIVGIIGSGGSGTIYRGHDPAIDREVAIKVLSPAIASYPEVVARFANEARAAGKLNDPHTVAIYEVGEALGLLHRQREHAARVRSTVGTPRALP